MEVRGRLLKGHTSSVLGIKSCNSGDKYNCQNRSKFVVKLPRHESNITRVLELGTLKGSMG